MSVRMVDLTMRVTVAVEAESDDEAIEIARRCVTVGTVTGKRAEVQTIGWRVRLPDDVVLTPQKVIVKPKMRMN